MSTTGDPSQLRPPWQQLPLEARAIIEFARCQRGNWQFENWPQGDGRPVLVIPGFGQSDQSTAPLRRFLQRQGFQASGWQLGRNQGLKSGMTARLLELIQAMGIEYGQDAALVGWSLGGVIARELARKAPEHVSHVVSLGSPLAGPQATTLQNVFRLLNPGKPAGGYDPLRHQPPPVRCTAIYTREDGIVAWQSAREPLAENTENIEVRGSHLGLGFNPAVWFAISHRLSPTTRNRPFSWPAGVPPRA